MKKILSFVSALLVAITASAAEFPAQPDFGALRFDAAVGHAAKAPQAQQALPVDLSLYSQTYNSAAFRWKYYGWSAAGFACVLWTADSKQVAYITWTIEAFEYIMYLDNISYELSDDMPIDYYIDTYWILNAPDGMSRGADWQTYTYLVTDGTNSMYALTEGKYRLDIYELLETGLGNGPVSIEFTLTDKKARNLKAEVAADNKTATLTWDQPTLKTGERLYVSVQSGAETVFDNYSGTPVATSPLQVDVKEGRTYSASIQAVDKNKKPIGSQVLTYFTVGVNSYKPENLKATVANYDQVTFSWTAPTNADYYRIKIYNDYGDLAYTINSATSPVKAQLDAGVYTWEITPYEVADGLYYPLSDPIAGNEFNVEEAPLEEGVVVLNAWYMDAGYAPYDEQHGFAEGDTDIKEGKYFWVIRLMTDENATVYYPQFWISIYSDREYAISGHYSVAKDNVHLGNSGMYNSEGTYPTVASDVELQLDFQGFDFELEALGSYDAIYSGYCKVTVGGTKYHINIQNLHNTSYDFIYFMDESSTPIYIDMIDEELGSAQGIEAIKPAADSDVCRKVLHDGALFIQRHGALYNATGLRVK